MELSVGRAIDNGSIQVGAAGIVAKERVGWSREAWLKVWLSARMMLSSSIQELIVRDAARGKPMITMQTQGAVIVGGVRIWGMMKQA